MEPLEKDVDTEVACPFPQEQGLCSAHTRHPAPSPVQGSWKKGAECSAEEEVRRAGQGSPNLGSALASPLPSFLTFE